MYVRIQVKGRWENRGRKYILKYTNIRDERVTTGVNSCVSKMDRIGMKAKHVVSWNGAAFKRKTCRR